MDESRRKRVDSLVTVFCLGLLVVGAVGIVGAFRSDGSYAIAAALAFGLGLLAVLR